MLKHVSPLVLIMAVSACSTPLENRQANGNDQYVSAKTEPKLAIPNGLIQPTYRSEYQLPVVSSNGKIGTDLDVRPPLQVLPTAEGTHVENKRDGVKIVIEAIDSKSDLKQEILSSLRRYLEHSGVSIMKQSENPAMIQTGWIETHDILESNFWSADKVSILRQRYEFDVDVKPHGRTGVVSIKLVDHEVNSTDEGQVTSLTDEDKRRYTIDMLNNAISYLSIERKAKTAALRLERSAGIKTVLINENETNYWVANAELNKVWDRLRIVLPEMGFTIADMDSSKGLYFVDLKSDSGFWSSMFGADDKLPLEDGSYRIEVLAKAEKTSIKLKNIDDEPVDPAILTAISKVFVNLMEEKRS
ncbi:MAG: outer membrane protein assembly factor BamC [Parashewanella sp.]